MLFTTANYFVFLPLVFLLHLYAPSKYRWLVLLFASFTFYGFLKAPHLIAILIFITTTTYFFGIYIEREKDQRTKKILLCAGVSVNLLILVLIKYLPQIIYYYGYIYDNVNSNAHVVAKPIIAIGASFFIFQAISYLVDVYLEVQLPEHHYGYFALYLAFFPKLLQGPIERGTYLLPQLKASYNIIYDNIRSGAVLFAMGMFKKLIIADRLDQVIAPIFGNPSSYSGLQLLICVYLYSLQIYFDFSGYTDMALGTARIFNIRLTPNFNSPYLATSIADFWRRWHISFSRWILDYIFKPLQMTWRNYGRWGMVAAFFITFTISGIWHGTTGGFVAWGILHGFYMSISCFYKPYQKKLYSSLGPNKHRIVKVWQIIITYHLVCLSWVFFRSRTMSDAFGILNHIFSIDTVMKAGNLFEAKEYSSWIGTFDIIEVCIALVAAAMSVGINKLVYEEIVFRLHVSCRWAFYYSLVMTITLLNCANNGQFIYFNF